MTSFTKEVNPRLAKRPLKTYGRLANLGLTSLVKYANGVSDLLQLDCLLNSLLRLTTNIASNSALVVL